MENQAELQATKKFRCSRASEHRNWRKNARKKKGNMA